MKPKHRKFVVEKPALKFECDWAVFPKHGHASICYTTGKAYAKLVAVALERFLNSPDGDKWLKKEMR